MFEVLWADGSTRTVKKTVITHGLRTPDSYTIECGGEKVTLPATNKSTVGDWIMENWRNSFFAEPAYVYCNIDYDSDRVLYCKYELE